MAAAGMSGNNKPSVAYTLKVRTGVEIDSKGKAAGKGALWQDEKAYTLATTQDQTLFQPITTGIIDNIGGQAEYGYESEVNGTLRAGAQGAIFYALENHPADSRVTIDDSGIVQTLTSRMGTGGGNVPMVMEPTPIHDQATRFAGKRGDKSDGKGNGLGVGGPGDPMNTLTAGDRHAVAYCTDVGFLNSQEEVSPTLLARSYKDPHLVSYPESAVRYIVRRLTPTECARLQGFADRWGDIDEKDSFTPEEYEFWLTVRNTHAAINGKKVQDYTEAQMLTWYSKLHTDGAEYKMWGNGIALPPALYCMQGMVDALNAEPEDDWML